MSKLDHLKPPRVQPMVYKNPKGQKEGILYKDMPIRNVIFCGHVDAGKSTTTGELLRATGLVSEHTIQQFRKEAMTYGKESFAKAWITDTHRQERELGKTMDICHVELFTGSVYYTIIDAPGHGDYVKNMITGATQADVMALIVDAEALYSRIKAWKASYESETEDPLRGWSTRQHATISRGLGVSKGIIILNKMDSFSDGQRKAVYQTLVQYVTKELKKCGFPLSPLDFAPISARDGIGITQPFPGLEQHQPSGLVQVLDSIVLPEDTRVLPLRMHIEAIYKEISGTNAIVTGKVQSGSLKEGDTVLISPSLQKAIVRSVEMHRKRLTAPAVKGCNIGIDLKGPTGKLEELKKQFGRNAILSHQDAAPLVATKFKAPVILTTMPSQSGLVVDRSKVILHMASGVTIPCILRGVEQAVDLETRELISDGKSLDAIGQNTKSILTFQADEPVPLQTKDTHPRNSCFVVREGRETMGWGSIIQIVREKSA